MNWAKNDRVRAVFVEEVKILENKPFAQNRNFRRFGGNFDFRGTGLILGGLTPIFSAAQYLPIFQAGICFTLKPWV